MRVMTESGLFSSTIVLVISVVGPLQKPICVITRWSACKARTRARQSRDQACVIWGKLLNLFEVPVINWRMLSTDGVTLRIKARQFQYRERRTQSLPFLYVLYHEQS